MYIANNNNNKGKHMSKYTLHGIRNFNPFTMDFDRIDKALAMLKNSDAGTTIKFNESTKDCVGFLQSHGGISMISNNDVEPIEAIENSSDEFDSFNKLENKISDLVARRFTTKKYVDSNASIFDSILNKKALIGAVPTTATQQVKINQDISSIPTVDGILAEIRTRQRIESDKFTLEKLKVAFTEPSYIVPPSAAMSIPKRPDDFIGSRSIGSIAADNALLFNTTA